MIRRSPVRRGYDMAPVHMAEDVPKISGPENLSREGWNEDQCRNFLVRVLDWVPRNFNYEDGLTIIHPQLQERFGDENVDLACGVLDELIEIDECNPFPGSSYQRWKHTHRTRHENLLLPHVPHTATIMSQVVPTKTLLEWRAKNNKSGSPLEAPRISPTSPTFQSGISTITHRSAWRIEHTLFVSTGGGKASVYHCPSPEEFHRRLWDPDYGRGGNMMNVKTQTLSRPAIRIGYTTEVPVHHLMDDNVSSALVSSPTREREARQQDLQSLQYPKARESPVCNMKLPVGLKDTTYEELSSSRLGPKPGTRPSPAYLASAQNVPLPHGVLVPNAVFARKHHLVQDEVPLPGYLLKGPIQPTAKQLGLANAEYISRLAKSAVRQSRNTAVAVDNTKEQDESLMREYFSYFKGPFTADLFYDSGLDFKWSTSSIERVQYVVPASTSGLSVGPKRRLFSCSPGKKKSNTTNSCPEKKTNPKDSSMNTTLIHQENRRNQVVTVDGKRHLINSEGSVVLHRRLLSVFRRKETTSVGNSRRVPFCRKDSPQPDSTRVEAPCEDSLDRVARPLARDKSPSSSPNIGDSNAQEVPVGFAGKQVRGRKRLRPLTPESPTRPSQRIARSGIIPVALSEKSSTAPVGLGEILKPAVYCPELSRSGPGLATFDGAADEIFLSRRNTNKGLLQTFLIFQSWLKIQFACSTLKLKHIKAEPRMDDNRDLLHRSAQPAPLKVRKHAAGHIRAATKRDREHDTSASQQTSSKPMLQHPGDSDSSSQRNPAIWYPSDQVDTTISTRSSGSHEFIPDTSAAIMGDFVALTTSGMENQLRSTDDDIALLSVAARHRFPVPTHNPYEFERSPLLDRLDDEGHLARFRDFMKEQEAEYVPSPRTSHMKNSFSAGNATYMTRQPSPPRNLASKPSKHNFHRSESSPTISPIYQGRQQPRFQSPENSPHFLSQYDSEDEGLQSPDYHDYRKTKETASDSRRGISSNVPAIHSAHRQDGHPRRTSSRSPTRQAGQVDLHGSFSSSSNYSRTSRSSVDPRSSSSTNQRYPSISPTKQLDNVIESDEANGRTPRAFIEQSVSPPKRSRSPMKKMFGEKGWLSHSPIVNQGSQVPPLPKKYNTPKKSTMIGKIKNKFGEMAEKADMSPMFRSHADKNARPTQATVTRSIAAFEQARIYTELELMMVHTANVFLMNEFSQARISIDTIRKTIDSWKSKGRPMVTEFMYDQLTQRNLVALNQSRFRFHGPQAGNELRISSMLYSWKQVANIMAVRTFCDTDSVILKLLFDIEHILELLGAGEPFMLRLQDISKSVKDAIQVARYKKQLEQAQIYSKNQQPAELEIPHNSTPSRGHAPSNH